MYWLHGRNVPGVWPISTGQIIVDWSASFVSKASYRFVVIKWLLLQWFKCLTTGSPVGIWKNEKYTGVTMFLKTQNSASICVSVGYWLNKCMNDWTNKQTNKRGNETVSCSVGGKRQRNLSFIEENLLLT